MAVIADLVTAVDRINTFARKHCESQGLDVSEATTTTDIIKLMATICDNVEVAMEDYNTAVSLLGVTSGNLSDHIRSNINPTSNSGGNQ